MPIKNNDEYWMAMAIHQARLARDRDEVPIGAIITHQNKVIAKAHNQPISTKDPTAHAEILALRKAALHLNNYRLNGTTLYVTLEPCMMCLTAMLHARVDRLVYAASDIKKNNNQIVAHIFDSMNHSMNIESGVLADEASQLLKCFFREKR